MATHTSGQVRIIGGQWKRRRLRFAGARVRPSPDAVRETVFNWLAPYIDQARCLDLFAGSGAFGFEAASRGAASVVMVENDRRACACIRDNCARLPAGPPIELRCTQVDNFLRASARQFDIIFIDPPFGTGAIGPVCAQLQKYALCASAAKIYIESATIEPSLPLPESWHIMRQTVRGAVRGTLIQAA